jgi:hypothetical protein
VSKEYVTDPQFAGKYRLFPVMSTNGRYQHTIVTLTNTQLITGTINATLARATVAVG